MVNGLIRTETSSFGHQSSWSTKDHSQREILEGDRRLVIMTSYIQIRWSIHVFTFISSIWPLCRYRTPRLFASTMQDATMSDFSDYACSHLCSPSTGTMRNIPSLEANPNSAALRAYVGHFLILSSVIVLLTQVVARCPQVEEGPTYPLECALFFGS